jgi:hypothetical protein
LGVPLLEIGILYSSLLPENPYGVAALQRLMRSPAAAFRLTTPLVVQIL